MGRAHPSSTTQNQTELYTNISTHVFIVPTIRIANLSGSTFRRRFVSCLTNRMFWREIFLFFVKKKKLNYFNLFETLKRKIMFHFRDLAVKYW